MAETVWLFTGDGECAWTNIASVGATLCEGRGGKGRSQSVTVVDANEADVWIGEVTNMNGIAGHKQLRIGKHLLTSERAIGRCVEVCAVEVLRTVYPRARGAKANRKR